MAANSTADIFETNAEIEYFSLNGTKIDQPDVNNWTNASSPDSKLPPEVDLSKLALGILIVATATGNTLVCVAVWFERSLHNMANYFLTSLAVADLLVAIFVMPVGMVIQIYGLHYTISLF